MRRDWTACQAPTVHDILRHELRVPLSAAAYALEALEAAGIAETAEHARWLATARMGVLEAQHLAQSDDALGLSTKGAPPPSQVAVPVRWIIDRALALVPDVAQRTALYVPEDLPLARADAPSLLHALTNLLDNAGRHACLPGAIRLAVRQAAKDRLEIALSDPGPGITVEQQAQIFQPPVRCRDANQTQEGHGIGLRIVASLVARMGGELRVESDSGTGTAFVLTLPAVPQSSGLDS